MPGGFSNRGGIGRPRLEWPADPMLPMLQCA
jgi:hypothetical protein